MWISPQQRINAALNSKINSKEVGVWVFVHHKNKYIKDDHKAILVKVAV